MRKVLKYILIVLASFVGMLIIVPVITTAIWYNSADMLQPPVEVRLEDYPVIKYDSWAECYGNRLRQSESGLWEVYLHGAPVERGAALGRLTEDLLYYQEKVFVDQIRRIVPSDGYLKFLRYLLVGFNRNLGENVPAEFRKEIYGISLSCTDEFDAIGTSYQRQLNYHAAHDIGHTMQEYMLVGCSSFAVWDGRSADSTLLVGRNFDFWVGDEFARNKLIAFYAPECGYRFASVTWPGMTGVLSGMNEQGLTITINAAKGALPTSSAMPISLLAREILQYAATIDEAYAIARKRQTFVSESLLVGSAADGRAAVIEKTPKKTALFTPAEEDYLVCTNHYQSAAFAADKYNLENIATSDSPYRQARIDELIRAARAVDRTGAVEILRDRLGPGGEDIGVANPMSINQSIAHHSVVFEPEHLRMWVTTGVKGWQSGEWVCYDLGRIFGDGSSPPDFSSELQDKALAIPADSLFMVRDYPQVLEKRAQAAKQTNNPQ